MLVWSRTKFHQTSKVFLRKYVSCTKFAKVLLRAYIRLTKSDVYFGYNVLCTEDDMYKFFVHIFRCKLVTGGLDVNGLVMNGPDVSNIYLTTK